MYKKELLAGQRSTQLVLTRYPISLTRHYAICMKFLVTVFSIYLLFYEINQMLPGQPNLFWPVIQFVCPPILPHVITNLWKKYKFSAIIFNTMASYEFKETSAGQLNLF